MRFPHPGLQFLSRDLCVEGWRIIWMCWIQCWSSGNERQNLYPGWRLFTWWDHRWSTGKKDILSLLSIEAPLHSLSGFLLVKRLDSYRYLLHLLCVFWEAQIICSSLFPCYLYRCTTVGGVSGRKWLPCPGHSQSSTARSSVSTDTGTFGATQHDKPQRHSYMYT